MMNVNVLLPKDVAATSSRPRLVSAEANKEVIFVWSRIKKVSRTHTTHRACCFVSNATQINDVVGIVRAVRPVKGDDCGMPPTSPIRAQAKLGNTEQTLSPGATVESILWRDPVLRTSCAPCLRCAAWYEACCQRRLKSQCGKLYIMSWTAWAEHTINRALQ